MSLIIEEGYNHKNEVKELFKEYTDLIIQEDETFSKYLQMQDFEHEVNHLEEKYGKPGGRIYVAYYDGELAGCIGLKKIDKNQGEMKRLYVRQKFRGKHIGLLLAKKIVEDAKKIGYKAILLDTLPSLESAIKMYKKMGFYEISQYNDSPMKDAIYLKLDL